MRTTISLVIAISSFSAVLAQDTGCDMNAGSALMLCLGDMASVPPTAAQATGVAAAQELCEKYTKLAGCWAEGTYCAEWYPMQIAADKLCALAAAGSTSSIVSSLASSLSANGTLLPTPTSPGNASTITPAPSSTGSSNSSSAESSTQIPSETLESVIAEASRVITSIWNNDSGTDIPVVFNDVNTTQTRPTWTKAGETSPGQTDPPTPTPTAAAGTIGGSNGGTSGAVMGSQASMALLGAAFSTVAGALWLI